MWKPEDREPHEYEALFELPAVKIGDLGGTAPRGLKRPELPVWTENKARLIERYLHFFVLVTKHGNYIDGFAGPQYRESDVAPAAQLVLESEPSWLRHFYLFDKEAPQVAVLHHLKEQHRDRDIHVFQGDFNKDVDRILNPEFLKPSEAAFCLLDQRTFECEWSTVCRVAQYKADTDYKVEIFYFLANLWLDRARSALKDYAQPEAWWGGGDWLEFLRMHRVQRALIFARRFREELGYRFTSVLPIYGKHKRGRQVMYYMIHAADHDDAPKLMERAYMQTVFLNSFKQARFDLGPGFEAPL